MTKKLLVLLVSDQTVPNVQFLKWYLKSESKNSDVDLLLVSTDKMEQNETSDKILNAAEYFHDSYKTPYVISVKQNDVNDVKIQLDNFFNQYSYDEVVSNITGGTKLMSLSVYQYFAGMKNSAIYYKPIDGDMVELFPEYKTMCYDIKLNFDEYMAALGLQYKSDENFYGDYDFNKKFYENCYKPMRSDKNYRHSAVQYCGNDQSNCPEACKRYISGGWLEELACQHIKKKYALSDEQVRHGVKIAKKDLYNGESIIYEADVMYLYNGKLHVIECKAFSKNKGDSVRDALIALKSLRDTLGLSLELYLYTTATLSDAMLERAEEFGIHVVYGNMLRNL